MPKNTFTPLPPIEKLPLAVRKSIRDEWENKKADIESQLETIFGFPIKFNFNPSVVWAYAEASGASDAGSTLHRYAEGFVSASKSYVDKYHDIGKSYFKYAVSKSEVTLAVNERGNEADAISAEVKDGVFRILFKQDRFGLNQSWLADPFVKAINGGPHDGFTLLVKHSVETEYNAEVEDTQAEIGKILNLPDVVLDPNFDENYAKLLKKADSDWQENFGKATLAYFHDGVRTQIKNQGFEGDDMLQEGFAEGVPSKTFKIRIVDKTKSGSALETVLEDGTVYIQMTIDRWWYNVYSAGEGLVDLL